MDRIERLGQQLIDADRHLTNTRTALEFAEKVSAAYYGGPRGAASEGASVMDSTTAHAASTLVKCLKSDLARAERCRASAAACYDDAMEESHRMTNPAARSILDVQNTEDLSPFARGYADRMRGADADPPLGRDKDRRNYGRGYRYAEAVLRRATGEQETYPASGSDFRKMDDAQRTRERRARR